MALPLNLQLAVSAAMAEITRQRGADPSLVVSDPDDDGRVSVEGTLDLAKLAEAILVRQDPAQ